MKNWSDESLFSAIRGGNKEALGTLFLRHNAYLRHYGLRVSSDRSLVEDCIQELFIYLFEAGSRIGEVRQVKAYLFKSLRRRIVERIRQSSRRRERETAITAAVNIRFSEQDFSTDPTASATHQTLAEALNKLPWRQREAVYLRYYNGLNTQEISDVMGIANQTVLNTLYQALQKLRKQDNLLLLIGLILLFLLMHTAHF